MVTMSDVADAAGVSRATVSYALRGDPRIAPATAEKILQAAQDLHYTTNLSARSLRSGKNGVVAVAIFELDRPYPSQMAAVMARAAARHNMQTIVQQTSISKDDEISVLRNVTNQLCDGTVFSPGVVSNEEIRALIGGKPIVLLDDFSPEPVFDSVDTPCVEGAQAAMTHLLDIGCHDIMILGAEPEARTVARPLKVRERRVAGCRQALEQHDMPLTDDMFIQLPAWSPELARDAARRLVRGGRPVDGVFCMTDTLAMGFMRGLADMGVRVPDDVAVIGFDGIADGEYSIPSLSTVRVDLDDLADKAIDMLLKRINGIGPEEPQRLVARFDLVERESTQR